MFIMERPDLLVCIIAMKLKFSDSQKKFYGTDEINKIYLEYYILKVNKFNEVAKDGLDEWIYFLKNDEVKKGFSARGLKEAAAELDVMKMPREEQQEYENYYDHLRYRSSMYESTYVKGEKEGMEKGEAKGRFEGKIEMARKLKKQGVAIEIIAAASGLTVEKIEEL